MNPLNRIFNPNPDSVYYTPPVIAQQVIHNQTGANVTIINPPFSMEKPKPKKWIKRWHAFGLFFAVSNTRLKKRDTRPYTGGWKTYHEDRNAVWEAQGHKCPICGTEFQSHKDM